MTHLRPLSIVREISVAFRSRERSESANVAEQKAILISLAMLRQPPSRYDTLWSSIVAPLDGWFEGFRHPK